MAPKKQNTYLVEETEEMRRKGYLTIREAAAKTKVRVDRIYRAIKAHKVRVKLGENAYNRYVHMEDWLKLVKVRRGEVLHSLGLG